MIQELEVIRPVRPSPKLTLHCGAQTVDLADVRKVKMPGATSTWTPIAHHQLIDLVTRTLQATRLRIGAVAHSLSHDGQRYFGLMEIQSRKSSDDYCWVLGLRNSHDKTFPAGVVAGASVFVCDNLSFSGEVKLARKHTRFINRDLPQLVERGIGMLMDKWHHQDFRFAAYRENPLDDRGAHDLIIRATDVGICSNRLIPAVVQEWREPRHEAFNQRNVWRLFNAFTEALKEGNIAELPKRTEALHGLLDSHVGLN